MKRFTFSSRLHSNILVLILILLFSSSHSQEQIRKLDNPMSVTYLKNNLLETQPRLVLNPQNEKLLRQKLANDPVVQNMYKAIQLNASRIYEQPLPERIVTGKRLLSVSRAFLYRINMLGMVYFVEKDPKVLERINAELNAVCTFSDWNPSHFLDVAEMALGIALALDWTTGDLPRSTINLAHTALIEKGLNPSYASRGMGWIKSIHNWNQVCHGGMIAAAISIAEINPELAANTISRALDNIPLTLKEYGPDGVYPEGATYWSYGTGFSVITSSMLSSAFGTDFGLADYPGFKESAVFKMLMESPSGLYYNYGDCGLSRGKNGDIFLAWFAAQTGKKALFEKERFLRPADKMGLSRLAGAGLVWLAQYTEKEKNPLPAVWIGGGTTPIIIFKNNESDQHKYYFAAKGGMAGDNHANMDNGSFIFELNGVRWAVDLGSQGYHELEKTGFDLWSRGQDSDRWTLLTKYNFSHSTITVNNAPHSVDGRATLLSSQTTDNPQAMLDLTPTFGDVLKSAKRTFIKDSPTSIIIKDEIETSESTELVTWQLVTQADVEIVKGGALLKQDGTSLKLENLSHPQLMVSVISLDPPPLALDKRLKNLKRIDIQIPAWTMEAGKTTIKVRLAGE
jgi:hypothetical protein